MTFTLPLPPRELSPNARVHWRRKATVTAAYRSHAKHVAWSVTPASQRPGWTEARAEIVVYAPDRRRRDRDNLMASLKAAWDGLVDAGILADDSGLHFAPLRLEWDKDAPRVEITLTGMDA
jgi:crossover junction endodeoxyribonuclease RusA